MKVFEVITEYSDGDSKEIHTMVQYVTSEENTLLSVTEYFTKHCEEYDKELKSVKEIVVITEHIKQFTDNSEGEDAK